MAAVLSLKDQCDADEREEFSEILNLVTYDDSEEEQNEPKGRKDKKRKAGRKAKNGLVVESDSDSDEVNPTVKKPKRL